MDVERCVALHNEILRSSWTSSGRESDSLESACHTWFDTFGDEAEAVCPDLAPDLVTFLQRARVIYGLETGVHLDFFIGCKILLRLISCSSTPRTWRTMKMMADTWFFTQ